MDFYNASSLKQHADSLGHIILINAACLEQKLEIQILLSVVWHGQGLNPQSTTLDANMLTITPPIMSALKLEL
jgi:hypothetical protein